MKNPCLLKASAEFKYAEALKSNDSKNQIILSADMLESIELTSFEGVLFISHYSLNIDKPNKLDGFLLIDDLIADSFELVVGYFKGFLSQRYIDRESVDVLKLITKM